MLSVSTKDRSFGIDCQIQQPVVPSERGPWSSDVFPHLSRKSTNPPWLLNQTSQISFVLTENGLSCTLTPIDRRCLSLPIFAHFPSVPSCSRSGTSHQIALVVISHGSLPNAVNLRSLDAAENGYRSSGFGFFFLHIFLSFQRPTAALFLHTAVDSGLPGLAGAFFCCGDMNPNWVFIKSRPSDL